VLRKSATAARATSGELRRELPRWLRLAKHPSCRWHTSQTHRSPELATLLIIFPSRSAVQLRWSRTLAARSQRCAAPPGLQSQLKLAERPVHCISGGAADRAEGQREYMSVLLRATAALMYVERGLQGRSGSLQAMEQVLRGRPPLRVALQAVVDDVRHSLRGSVLLCCTELIYLKSSPHYALGPAATQQPGSPVSGCHHTCLRAQQPQYAAGTL